MLDLHLLLPLPRLDHQPKKNAQLLGIFSQNIIEGFSILDSYPDVDSLQLFGIY